MSGNRRGSIPEREDTLLCSSACPHRSSGCWVRFLVFNSKTGQPSYETTVVEKSDDHGASNYFIRKVPISKYFSEESKRKFQVQATEAILMVDSAEQEYEADIYFWSNVRFRREPVDD